MRIPDQLIYPYFELITDVDLAELDNIKLSLENPKVNPMSLKRYLARTIVRMYHNEDAAQAAEKHFNLIHKEHDVPDDIPVFSLDGKKRRLIDLMVETKLASGTGEARRLIRQGGVKLEGKTVTDELMEISHESEMVLKVGKRKFLKVTP
jgi:tyrosyl-tRNA synthetase